MMARDAKLDRVEDPSRGMRCLVNAMLEEDAGHRARARELHGLMRRLRNHARRRPKPGWIRRARRPAVGETGPVQEMEGCPASAEDAPHAGLGPGGRIDWTTRQDRQGEGRKPGGGIAM